MTVEKQLHEPSEPTLSADSAGKGPILLQPSPMELIARVASGRRVLPRIAWRVSRWGRQLWISRSGRRLWWTTRMRANHGVCSIEISNKSVGFFAQMNWCLGILQYCEDHGLVPDIRLTGDIYLDHNRGSNWLDYYFDVCTPTEPEEIAERVRYTKKIADFEELGPPIAPQLSVDDGARTLHRYLRPKPHITMTVDNFWESLNADGPVVGVHYRGTDKTSEAPRVSWKHCLDVLKNYLSNHNNTRAIFVASDEQAFIEFMSKSIKNVPVYSHDDRYRSTDNRPVHTAFDEGDGYGKGEDALVNALLLAKCSTLIRTTSFLSAWASIFNPDLEVILLNKPYDDVLWFPEREILERCNTEYLPEGTL